MTITTITTLGAARNNRTPTKADAAETPTDGTGATEQPGLLQLVAKQVPVGLVAAYTGATSGFIQLIDEPTAAEPAPDQYLVYRWLALAILVLASAGLTYRSYRQKAGKAARQPIAEVLGVGIAAAAWGLMIPESPLLAMTDGPGGLALVILIGLAAVALNLVTGSNLRKPAAP
jgi:hypothetical protein